MKNLLEYLILAFCTLLILLITILITICLPHAIHVTQTCIRAGYDRGVVDMQLNGYCATKNGTIIINVLDLEKRNE